MKYVCLLIGMYEVCMFAASADVTVVQFMFTTIYYYFTTDYSLRLGPYLQRAGTAASADVTVVQFEPISIRDGGAHYHWFHD